jgi:hypothetical protein
VKCWGFNSYGQLGNNSTDDKTSPDLVKGISNASAIAASERDTCAVLKDGTVKCWGDNGNGQLGDGSNTSSNTPVAVQGLSGASSVAPGSCHTCALMKDGSIKCWGYNGYGELGDGTTTDVSTPVRIYDLPLPSSPAGGYTLAQGKTSLALKWAAPVFAGTSVKSYHVVVRYTADNSTAIEKTTSAKTLTLTGLLPNTPYDWRVQANYKDGSTGPYTEARTFSTVKVKNPVLGAPGSNSLQIKPTVKFTWSKPSGLPKTGYQYVLQYDTAADFATCENDTFTTCTELAVPLKNSTILSFDRSISPLTYYWRVKVTNTGGTVDYSDWSSVTKSFLR